MKVPLQNNRTSTGGIWRSRVYEKTIICFQNFPSLMRWLLCWYKFKLQVSILNTQHCWYQPCLWFVEFYFLSFSCPNENQSPFSCCSGVKICAPDVDDWDERTRNKEVIRIRNFNCGTRRRYVYLSFSRSCVFLSMTRSHTFVEWRVLTKASTLVYRLHHQEVSLTLYNKLARF